jgi:hypothetical protein
MPRKIRELIAELERAGWKQTHGGKGSHRKFAHSRSVRKVYLEWTKRSRFSQLPGEDGKACASRGSKMKPDYLKFVQWNESDDLYVGYCPDLFIGGVYHGAQEQKVYRDLCNLVGEELAERAKKRHPLPRRLASVTMPVAV